MFKNKKFCLFVLTTSDGLDGGEELWAYIAQTSSLEVNMGHVLLPKLF